MAWRRISQAYKVNGGHKLHYTPERTICYDCYAVVIELILSCLRKCHLRMLKIFLSLLEVVENCKTVDGLLVFMYLILIQVTYNIIYKLYGIMQQ